MNFENRTGKRAFIALASFSGIALYIGLISVHYLAAQLSTNGRAGALKWAVRLEPFNAEYHNARGRFALLSEQSPASAHSWLVDATRLDPYRASYWLDRAISEELLGNFNSERESLSRATAADPHSAAVAWEVANRYLAQASTGDALREYRRVMESDPSLTPQAIQICWKIRPNIDDLLQNVFPVNVDEPLLSFLVSQHESEAAAKVWDRIVSLQQPVGRAFLFDYLRHLFADHDALQAQRVWQQAATLAGLAAYQPTEDNLLVNSDFGLDVLNGGFDWTYRKMSGVSIALDPINGYSGARSLRIFFEGAGIVDAGIRQIVFVEPNTSYEFSAHYKAQEMDGAGGVRFAIQDVYSDASLFMSDDLRDVEFWTQINGAFTTGPDTHLLVLRIARVPGGSPIRGKLWIDDLKLVSASHLASVRQERP